MVCVLCLDIAKHNMFIQLHRNASPRAPKCAEALGVTSKEILLHRQHRGAFTVIYPIPVKDSGISGSVEKSESSVESLRELKSTLSGLLTQIRNSKNIKSADVVRVVSELKSLIIASEDLEIKLAAASGSENSAFTQPELKEVFELMKGICPECRVKLCGQTR